MDQPKKYESIKHFVSITGFVLDVLILGYLLVSGWSIRIRRFAASIGSSGSPLVLLYVLIAGGICKLVQLPLEFYSTYHIERRFGLSRQPLSGWIKDEAKSMAIGIPLRIGAVEVIYYLLRTF